jgi:hypothetical protein
LLAYITVINARYEGGIVNAILIALVAWVATTVVLYALAVVGIGGFEAVGIPGV